MAPVRPPVKTAVPQQQDSTGCAILAVIMVGIGLVAGVSKCSSSTTSTNTTDLSGSNLIAQNISSAVAAQGPPPVQPLSESAVKQGTAQVRQAEKAESLSGAMIYSENCYDALSHQFSWKKLDSCGAADMLAVRTVSEIDVAGLDNEVKYFDSEAAAGRYLAAATGAGEPAGEADRRLSDLQTRVARAPLPIRKPTPSDPVIGNSADGNVVITYNESGE